MIGRDAKRDVGVYVGYEPGTVSGGLVYFPSSSSVSVRGDLIKLDIHAEEFQRFSNNRANLRNPDATPETTLVIGDDSPQAQAEVKPEAEALEPYPVLSKKQAKGLVRRMLTRSTNKAKAKLTALMVNLSKDNDLTFALEGPDGARWNEALLVEVDSLFDTTKTLIEEKPAYGSKYDIVYVTVVLKKKMLDEVKVDKYKVRICCCGNQLIARPDYHNETYSPTVSNVVHALLLQLSVTDNMHTATLDTISAYLHQEYPEDVTPLYLKFPKALAKACGREPDALYRVKKYLYGLPDAGRAYYIALSTHLMSNGYTKSRSDPCLFYYNSDGIRTYIWTHVDDLFISSTHPDEISSTHPDEIERLHQILSLRFTVKLNETIDAHLGINFTKLDDKSILLTQPKLLNEILEYAHNTKPTKYPSSPSRNNTHRDEPQAVPQKDYLQLLGKLLYLTNSRPDIATTVSFSATKSSNPKSEDYEGLLNIVNYLRFTKDEGLRLYPSPDGSTKPLRLVAYSDASYMSHPDGKSHTGYTIGLCTQGSEPKSFFLSKSTKQKLTATSSTHSEIRAVYQLVIQLIFIYNLFTELGGELETPIMIHEDNQACIHLTQDPEVSPTKSKHYIMLTAFIRDQVQNGLIQLSKIPTEDNIANVLTKLITTPEFTKSFNRIMGIYNQNGEQLNEDGKKRKRVTICKD